MNSFEIFFADSPSDDENEVSSEFMMFAEECWEAHQASQPKESRNQITRDCLGAHNRLVTAYFCDHPIYGDEQFHDRFWMSRRLFTRIVREITGHSSYFQQTSSCAGVLGISPLMKCTSSIRQLAYGVNADALEEYVQMGVSTISECLQKFCEAIMELYGTKYFWKPTVTDINRLYEHHYQSHGFPGIIGSIDCTDWPWENCPHALKAQFCRGDHGKTPFFYWKRSPPKIYGFGMRSLVSPRWIMM